MQVHLHIQAALYEQDNLRGFGFSGNSISLCQLHLWQIGILALLLLRVNLKVIQAPTFSLHAFWTWKISQLKTCRKDTVKDSDLPYLYRVNCYSTNLMACSRWACRTSGFWLRLAKMSLSVAPVIALWNFTVRRVRFFVISSWIPFLCLRRYSTVQCTLRGLRLALCSFAHLEFTNW